MVSPGLNYKHLVLKNAVTRKYAEFYIVKLLMRPVAINKPLGTTPNLRAFRIFFINSVIPLFRKNIQEAAACISLISPISVSNLL